MNIPVADAPFAYALLAIIPLASLYGLMFDRSFIQSGLFHVGAVIRQKQIYRLITSAFLHADGTHLLVNMLTLFFFGPAIEYIYGTTGFVLLFLGSQLGAELLTLARRKHELNYSALGASGAVSGILMAFCVYAPFEMLYLFFAIPIPAIVFAVGYIAYSTFAMGGKGRIAHEAHLGGAFAGAGIALLLLTI